MENTAPQKLFNKCFILVWLAALGLNITQNILNNSVSLFITSLGMSTGFAGFLGIPYAVCAILMRFIGGSWADRRSRRSLLVFGCMGFGISSLLFGFLPMAVSLVIFRAVHGFCFSAGQLACSTVNMDVTPPEKSTLGIGIFWVSTAVAFGAAGYMVTGLTSGGSYSPVFIACAVSGILAGIAGLFCDYEKGRRQTVSAANPSSDSYHGILRFIEPRAWRPSILMFLMAAANCSATLYLLLFAQERGYSNPGFAFLLAAFGMAVGNFFSDSLQRKIGARNLLILSFAFSAACYCLMGLLPSYLTYCFGGIACGYIQGICMPVLYYLGVKDMPSNRRGVSGGTVYFMLDLGVGIGSWLWGILIDAAGFSATYTAAGILFLTGAVCSLLFYLRRKT